MAAHKRNNQPRKVRRERQKARQGKPAKSPHPETIKRRRRKEVALRLDAMPVCSIGRNEIPEKDRIFVSQASMLPGKPHPSTVGRWIRFGVQLRSESPARLKLPAFRHGSRHWTSLRHFEWWQQQLDNAG